MSIAISADLILIGMFTKSQKTIKPEHLWKMSQSFYEVNSDFLVDISSDAIHNSCLRRARWFYNDLEDHIHLFPDQHDKFQSGDLLTLFLKPDKKYIQTQIRQAFGLIPKKQPKKRR